MTRLAEALGGQSRKTVAETLQAATLPAMRVATGCRYHFWQGKPGLWRTLLTAAEVEVLAPALTSTLAELGYACDPDPSLTAAQADANWINLVGKDLVEDLRSLELLRGEMVGVRATLAPRDEALQQTRAEVGWLRQIQSEQVAELEWRRAVQEQQAAELEWRRAVQEQQAAELEWRRAVQEQQAAELEWRRVVQEQQAAELGVAAGGPGTASAELEQYSRRPMLIWRPL